MQCQSHTTTMASTIAITMENSIKAALSGAIKAMYATCEEQNKTYNGHEEFLEDLFKVLFPHNAEVVHTVTVPTVVKEKAPKQTKEEKEAEKAAKLAEKEAEKAAKLAAKEAEKAAKEAEKAGKKKEPKGKAKTEVVPVVDEQPPRPAGTLVAVEDVAEPVVAKPAAEVKPPKPKTEKPKKVAADVNLKKVDNTLMKKITAAAKELKVTIPEGFAESFVAHVNAMTKEVYDMKALADHAMEFLTPKADEEDAEAEVVSVTFKGLLYDVDTTTGIVYRTTENDELEKVGTVGMAEFAGMKMPA